MELLKYVFMHSASCVISVDSLNFARWKDKMWYVGLDLWTAAIKFVGFACSATQKPDARMCMMRYYTNKNITLSRLRAIIWYRHRAITIFHCLVLEPDTATVHILELK